MSDESRYACPRCQQPMTHGESDAAKSALCASCGGVWLERGVAQDLGSSLGQLRAEQAAQISATILPKQPPIDPADDVSLRCPVCSGNLGKQRFPPLTFEVDRCLTDGTFFDHGELREVLRHLVRTGQLRRAHDRREADPKWAAANPSVAIAVPPDAGGSLAAGVADTAVSALGVIVDVAGDVVVGVIVELPGALIGALFD